MSTEKMGTVRGVIGCTRCAKPCALVGDVVPADGLCPWCRNADAPGVVAAWLTEHRCAHCAACEDEWGRREKAMEERIRDAVRAEKETSR